MSALPDSVTRRRMIRTLHFAPADDARKVARLRTLPADVIVLDLEDAVAESAKDDARNAAAMALTTPSWRSGVAVRTNGLRTPHFDVDVDAVVIPGLELLVVPKIEEPDDLRAVEAVLTRMESQRALAPPIGVIALIETAIGIANANRIAAEAPDRLERLVFGSVDFRANTGVSPSEGEPELLYARSRIVVAAAIAGRGPALDGPYEAVNDNQGLRADCERSRRIGFGGRVTIHPGQLDTVNETYSLLDEEEASRLAAIVSAFEHALSAGVASIRVGDTFVDYPVYREAHDRLELHRLASAPGRPGAGGHGGD